MNENMISIPVGIPACFNGSLMGTAHNTNRSLHKGQKGRTRSMEGDATRRRDLPFWTILPRQPFRQYSRPTYHLLWDRVEQRPVWMSLCLCTKSHTLRWARIQNLLLNFSTGLRCVRKNLPQFFSVTSSLRRLHRRWLCPPQRPGYAKLPILHRIAMSEKHFF